jgi:hypothetical protein
MRCGGSRFGNESLDDKTTIEKYIASFEGAIEKRVARPGEKFYLYSSFKGVQGDFLTKYPDELVR